MFLPYAYYIANNTLTALSEKEPEMVLDDLLKSFDENVISAKSVDDSKTEAPHANSDVQCFSEDEKVNEVSKDDDSVEISAEEINESDKSSLPTEDLDVTEVHKSSIAEEFELSLPHENVEEETEVDGDDALSSDEESLEVKDDQDENDQIPQPEM
ncbi:major centromere autoantigen B-like [Cucumis sativus]|uniref:major centromere autoantigen B-like n=1 Tax=Cucumis sativus TaxID=3659 RepID=UPI0012F4CBB1|nr:major centromere autoantigen B-like [Cucumis sativus]